MNKRIVISGNYGATNIGDEAILSAILNLITRGENLSLCVLSANPAETASLHPWVDSFYHVPAGFRSFFKSVLSGEFKRTLNTIKNADAFVLGGGGLFTDEYPKAVIIWAIQAHTALHYRIPLYCIGQSVGPLRSFWSRIIVKNIFNKAVRITVRDGISKKVLADMGIENSMELADTVFGLPRPVSTGNKPESYLVISLRKWIGIDKEILVREVAGFVDWLYSVHNIKSVLTPFQLSGDGDYEILEAVLNHVESTNSAEIFSFSADYRSALELISRSRAVFGMRLHSLIFSALSCVPFVALSYSTKVTGLMKQFDLENFCLQPSEWTFDNLKSKFELLEAEREELIGHIGSRGLDLRVLAEKHFKDFP